MEEIQLTFTTPSVIQLRNFNNFRLNLDKKMKIESGASQGKDFGEEMLAIRKAKRDLISQFSLSALKVVDSLD